MAIITTTSTIYSNFKRNNSSTKIVGMSTVLGVSLLLHHDMAMIAPSDSQLAICSLVCTVWRRAAVEGVVRCAMNGVLAAINPTATLDNAGEGGGENIGRTDFNLVQGLLITEMAKMLVLQRIQNTREHQHQDGGDHKPNYAIVNNHQQNKQGPFCLAWFEPSGIQMTSIVMKGHRDEEDRRTKYPRIVQECCHEWRGYRTPWEVLRPFGYDDNFVSVSFFVGSC